jgi:hypothetical protein
VKRNGFLDASFLRDKSAMRRAVILSEILGPCKGNR